ncbi:MAG: hypothetical protein ACTSRH_08130 [Promethearchaeota archaeon]
MARVENMNPNVSHRAFHRPRMPKKKKKSCQIIDNSVKNRLFPRHFPNSSNHLIIFLIQECPERKIS